MMYFNIDIYSLCIFDIKIWVKAGAVKQNMMIQNCLYMFSNWHVERQEFSCKRIRHIHGVWPLFSSHLVMFSPVFTTPCFVFTYFNHTLLWFSPHIVFFFHVQSYRPLPTLLPRISAIVKMVATVVIGTIRIHVYVYLTTLDNDVKSVSHVTESNSII